MFRRYSRWVSVFFFLGLIVCAQTRPLLSQTVVKYLGVFEGSTDVGSVTPEGNVVYDPAAHTYIISSAGANVWSTVDGFHFVWKKVSGDLSLTADIDFPDKNGNSSPHRKALLMFRQSLDADSVYADAAQHGSGLTALQYRRDKGATTQDIELNISSPKRLRIEKRGDTITMFLSMNGEPLHQVGASIKLHFDGPFYVGLGVCSHDAKTVEKSVFSNVELKTLKPATPSALALYSTLQTIAIDENARVATVAYTTEGHVEAPNWTRDGKALIFNQDGKIMTVPVTGGTPEALDIGAATRCNGSHGLSPDGKWLAISCSMPGKTESRVYLVPSSGGTPRVVTEHPDSYFHNWSPDGKIMTVPVTGGTPEALDIGAATRCNGSHGLSPDGKWLAISCSMPGKTESRVYIVPSNGGTPRVVTEHPDSYFHNWSPDGKRIIFTRPSHGSGNIYAIPVEGGEEKALTSGTGISDDPDCSPDGKFIYFNSDRNGGMQIWRMRSDGSAPEQMTFDDLVNWTPHVSPDGRSMVFLSYEKGVTGHPVNKDIALRIMSLDDKKVRVLVNLVGGSGTINVPSWAPDSRHLAFVSYQMLPAQDNGSSE